MESIVLQWSVSLYQYVNATSKRSWQAKLLLGCSLLHDLWCTEQKAINNNRAYKALARVVLSMLDALFDEVGEIAFKAVTALSGERRTWLLPTKMKLTFQRHLRIG